MDSLAPRSRPLGDEQVARLQAEVEVDRALLAILRSLKADPSAASLREHLLSHVMAGRDVATALLLLGRSAPGDAALARIEAKLDALASAPPRAVPDVGPAGAVAIVADPPAGARSDLFDVLPGASEAPAQLGARHVASEPLRRLVMSGLGIGPAPGADAQA